MKPLESPPPLRLSISIVTYRPDMSLLDATLNSLARAISHLPPSVAVQCVIVDNGTDPEIGRLAETWAYPFPCRVNTGRGNLGYGGGHNVAIAEIESDVHLILNPDVEMDEAALSRALQFLECNPQAGLLAPCVRDPQGALQYLCRRYPSLADLFLRGFAPASWRRRFDSRLARYEMRDCIGPDATVWDPPLISGCFMLFRTTVLKRLGGFDARYFLYFEDYDLSLRSARLARTVYFPGVQIVHFGGGAARKGWRHIKLFLTSMVRFFNRFGWRWK